jgi:hypothetical protein
LLKVGNNLKHKYEYMNLNIAELQIWQLLKNFPAFYGTRRLYVHKSPPLVPILSQIYPVHTLHGRVRDQDGGQDGIPSRDDGLNEGLAKGDDSLPRSDEAYLERKESTPVEMANVESHPEVPNEEAEVETVGALENRYVGTDI